MDDQADEIGAKRDRSPPFPYLGLEASIDLTRRLYQVARGSEVRLAQIAPHWNTTATSGALPRYAGALQGYGLIESTGSRETRKIKVTEVGRRILEDTRPGVGEELKEAAALRPKMFGELYSIWGRTRPSDDIARSALQFDYNFTPVAAKRFLAVYDEAMSYLSGDIAAPPVSVGDISHDAFAPAEASQPSESPLIETPKTAEISTGMRRDVFALEEGEATITVPRTISRASFEDLSDWLDLVMRRIERSLGS